jgi:hypothetical protein
MSIIPSSRGSACGVSKMLQKYDNTAGIMAIGTDASGVIQMTTVSETNVRDFDEVVLTVRCKDNFGNANAMGFVPAAYPPVAGTDWSFAQKIEIRVWSSTMIHLMEEAPVGGGSTKWWSPLFLENVVTSPKWTGAVEIGEYAIVINDIQIGAKDPTPGGPDPWLGSGGAVVPATEAIYSFRIPTTMAEWICFSIGVDTLGTAPDPGPGDPAVIHELQPVVDIDLYRGVPF